MFFKQFYLGCLAHASYMIGSDAEAAVVDPQRDVDPYLEEARDRGLAIRHVIETHLHADFVSGHRELAARAGAKIYFGWRAGVRFDHVPVRDGDEIRIGQVLLRFIETPGHTPESVAILVTDLESSSAPEAVLTGDTLFIGDVGRPDLLEASISARDLAGMLYDSLHEKLLRLPDHVRVYPAHGAGSLCGRNISSERSSTIGQERRFNYALKPMTRDEFIRMMTQDLPEAPGYFRMDARINREGPHLLDQLPPPEPLSASVIQQRCESNAVILDTRPSAQYGNFHVPGSINIGLGGQFASWAGTFIAPDLPIILVAENDERVDEARKRLARVGLENVIGYLGGGILAWHDGGLPLASIEQVGADELHARIQEGSPLQVLDVRRPPEWQSGHIPGAKHIPLNRLSQTFDALDPSVPIATICASGYRSSTAGSLLERRGYKRIANVVGGMTAWLNSKYPLEI